MAKLEIIADSGHAHRAEHSEHITSTEFPKKEGIKYCLNCGSECLSDIEMCSCGKNNFLQTDISEIIGGYIEKCDKLRNYYHKHYNTNSLIKMNNKRIIYYLLIHKHKINVDKKIVDKIYNSNNSNRGSD